MMLRDNLNGIAKGQITGVREEGIRVRDFVARRYSPTVKPTRFGDVTPAGLPLKHALNHAVGWGLVASHPPGRSGK